MRNSPIFLSQCSGKIHMETLVEVEFCTSFFTPLKQLKTNTGPVKCFSKIENIIGLLVSVIVTNKPKKLYISYYRKDLTSIKIIFPKTDRKYKPHKNNICTYL